LVVARFSFFALVVFEDSMAALRPAISSRMRTTSASRVFMSADIFAVRQEEVVD
jgi:hypothetical protein